MGCCTSGSEAKTSRRNPFGSTAVFAVSSAGIVRLSLVGSLPFGVVELGEIGGRPDDPMSGRNRVARAFLPVPSAGRSVDGKRYRITLKVVLGVAAHRTGRWEGCPMSLHQSFHKPIARSSKFFVIRCTRASGPCGRDQCDHGSMWPGGELSPWHQKMVEALKTKLPLGPG